ncbi:MAG TPA: hypothetical protein VGK71_06365 [Nitrospirota bacterium]
MKKLIVLLFSFLCIAVSSNAYAEKFDARKDYNCDLVSNGVWTFEGFRASDGAYLSMIFGHAPIKEISKYGVEAHYLPDGDQEAHPFITRMADDMMASPATQGRKFDSVLTWTAPYSCGVEIKGFARIMGNIKGESTGKKVKASLLQGGKVLWSGDVAGGQGDTEFSAKASVKKDEKIRFQVACAGDTAGDVTVFNVVVDTDKN